MPTTLTPIPSLSPHEMGAQLISLGTALRLGTRQLSALEICICTAILNPQMTFPLVTNRTAWVTFPLPIMEVEKTFIGRICTPTPRPGFFYDTTGPADPKLNTQRLHSAFQVFDASFPAINVKNRYAGSPETNHTYTPARNPQAYLYHLYQHGTPTTTKIGTHLIAAGSAARLGTSLPTEIPRLLLETLAARTPLRSAYIVDDYNHYNCIILEIELRKEDILREDLRALGFRISRMETITTLRRSYRSLAFWNDSQEESSPLRRGIDTLSTPMMEFARSFPLLAFNPEMDEAMMQMIDTTSPILNHMRSA